MSYRVGVFCAIICCLFILPSLVASQTANLPYSIQLHSNPTYILSWGLSPNNETLLGQLYLETWAWIGIGFKNGDSAGNVPMQDGDFIVGIFSSDGSLNVNDYFCACESAGEPPLDTDQGGIDNVLSFSGMQFRNTNGTEITMVQFERNLVTGDQNYDNPINDENLVVLYAFGSNQGGADPNVFGYHHDNAGYLSMNFFPSDSTVNTNSGGSNSLSLAYWHGCCMTIAFGFCMSIGVFFPRYLKSFWWWFPMHILIQISGVILAIAGFITIFVKAGSGNHFKHTHSWFGLITIGLALATPLLGTIAHFMWNATRAKIPIFPDQTHWWFGRATVVLSWVTIFLGMDLLGVPTQLFVAFAWVLGAYLIAYVWLDVMKIKEIGIRAYLFGAYTKKDDEPQLSDYY